MSDHWRTDLPSAPDNRASSVSTHVEGGAIVVRVEQVQSAPDEIRPLTEWANAWGLESKGLPKRRARPAFVW